MTTDESGAHEEGLEEAAALYAAGALTPEERRALEIRVEAQGPEALTLLRRYVAAAAVLAAAGAVAPPPEVRAALLRRVAEEQRGELGPMVVRSSDSPWEDTPHPGIRRRLLFVDHRRRQYTALVRMAPGASYPAHDHGGVEEGLVLEGDLRAGAVVLRPGDYQRAEPGSRHAEQTTEDGCLIFLIAPLP